MAVRVPQIIQAKKMFRHFSLTANAASTASVVPKGHLAVYVGEKEKRRFIVPVSILNQPSFQELLSQAEQEFGFQHPMGGLTIPCREDIFLYLTSQFKVL